MIFNSNYFQAIQAAVFYKKNVFKIFKSNLFMFLGLLVSCDKTKKLGNEKWTFNRRCLRIRQRLDYWMF